MSRLLIMGFALSITGCSVIVDGALEDEGDTDSGVGMACTGDAMCDDNEACTVDRCNAGRCENDPEPDGMDCDPMNMATARVCVAGVCGDSVCGDGFVDTSVGEMCDDGNDTSGDGCEAATSDRPCTPSCVRDADCRDGYPCNGQETCNVVTNACVPDTLIAANGTMCAAPGLVPGMCMSGECCDAAENCCGVDDCPRPDA